MLYHLMFVFKSSDCQTQALSTKIDLAQMLQSSTQSFRLYSYLCSGLFR